MDLATLGIRIQSSGATTAVNELNAVERQAEHTEKSIQSLTKMMGGLRLLMASGLGISGVSSLVQMADKMNVLNSQLRLVSRSTQDFTQAQKALFDIAQRTKGSLEATTTLYIRSKRALQDYGYSQQQVLNFTETLNKAMAVGGVGAQEQASALMQLSQALGSGRLQGDEFKTIAETAPIILDVVAEYMGKTRAEVKKIASDGEITSEVLMNAMSAASAKIAKDFDKLPLTFGQAMTKMENASLKFVDEFSQSTGVFNAMAEGVNFLTEHFNGLLVVIGSLTAGHLAKFGQSMVNNTLETRRQAMAAVQAAQAAATQATAELGVATAEQRLLTSQLQLARTEQERMIIRAQLQQQSLRITALTQAETVATERLAAAKKAASIAGRALNGVMGLFGGPLGIAVTALTMVAGGLYNYYQEAQQAKQATLEYSQSLDTSNESLKKMSSLQLEVAQGKLEASIEAQKEKIKELKETYEKLKKEAEQPIHQEFYSDGISAGIAEITKSQEQLRQENQKAKEALLALNDAQQQLTEAQEKHDEVTQRLTNQQRELMESMRESNPQFAEAFDRISQLSQIASVASGSFSAMAGQVAGVAVELAKLAQMDVKIHFPSAQEQPQKPQIGEKAQAVIDQSKRDIAIRNAKDPRQKAKLKAEDWVANHKNEYSEAELNIIKPQKEAEYLAMSVSRSGGGGRGKHKTKKSGHSGKSGENVREHWLTFYDELRKKSGSTLNEINLEQDRMFKRLDEHNKKGVVSHQEYETAKLAITERFAKQRLELAGKYAPEKLLSAQLKEELAAIQELQKSGGLTEQESKTAEQQAKFQYSQQQSQNAVSPIDKMRAIYDPNQALLNQQTQELAQLQAFYDQKLMAEDEFQRHKQEIIEKYNAERQNQELAYYSQTASAMSGAFDSMAGVIANYAGKQSGLYKTMFAASKAFAIADAIVKIQQGIANAAALPFPSNLPAMASVVSATASILSTIQSTQMGYATGGYTGDGGKYTPAGIVHKGEYVITKEATSRLGVGYLNYLNYGNVRGGNNQRGTTQGFAHGGAVGISSVPNLNIQGHSSPKVTVKVINNGEPVQAEVRSKSEGNQMEITVELVRQIAKQEANGVIQQNFRAGGAFA